MTFESLHNGNAKLGVGDCLELLREIPAGSVHCCVTSPPYWGLRQYMPDGVVIDPRLSKEKREWLVKELERRGIYEK